MRCQDPIFFGGRFAALAEDDTESVDNHEPDRCAEEVTQEGGCQGIPARRRRRLRIFWQEAIEADERDERFARIRQAVRHPWHGLAQDVREVRAVIQVFRQLVRRVGPVDLEGDVPRAIRHQHWSDFVCGQRHVVTGSVQFLVGSCSCQWTKCELGHPISRSPNGYTTKGSFNQGGVHIFVHEHRREFSISGNARCTGLESACVQITLQACEGMRRTVHPSQCRGWCPPREDAAAADVPRSPTLWQMLDDIDVESVHQTRFNVLQNCPVLLKGRFRQASRTTLEARHQAG